MSFTVLAATQHAHQIRALLAQEFTEGAIACETCRSDEMLERSARSRPDLVIAPITEGEQVEDMLTQLRRVSPGTRMLLLAGIPTQDMALHAIRSGASGILSDEPDLPALPAAVRTVRDGGVWFEQDLLYRTLHGLLCAPTAAAEADHQLTAREDEILTLIGEGLSNKEIGRRLAISDATVKTHLHRIYLKLNRSGRIKAFRAQPGGWGANSGWGGTSGWGSLS